MFHKKLIKNIDLSLNKELENTINASLKGFKVILFIENMNIKSVSKDYEVNNIELNLENID